MALVTRIPPDAEVASNIVRSDGKANDVSRRKSIRGKALGVLHMVRVSRWGNVLLGRRDSRDSIR